MRSCSIKPVAWAVSVVLSGAAPPANPAAEPAYPLTKDNGAWLVVVKSFQGPQAIEMANQLARELRQDHRTNAYTFTRRPDQSNGPQPAGFERGRVRKYEEALVVAADYKDEKEATKALDKIRNIRPKSITREMTSRYRWEVGVLTTAYLMPNPLAPKSPTEKEKPDPFLHKINNGPYNIYTCPGELSLRVAEFRGATALGEQQQKKFEGYFKDEKNSLLQSAGKSAEIIAYQLRRQGVVAYTYHGRYSSVVCVGSFSNPQDPQIEPLARQLAGVNVAGFTLSTTPVAVPVPKK